jgi:hypothetical protein
MSNFVLPINERYTMTLRNLLWIALLCLFSFRGMAQDLQQIGKGKAVTLSGTLGVQGGPYLYLGSGDPRNDPFWWSVNGSPTLSIYGWQLPFSFNFGSRQRSFSQPFNRYGVSPYYKWLTLHFGYRSIRFNPYVMSGLQFLGAGVEMNPKGFRFAAFYGRFAKPVRQDTLASVSPIPAYRRMGYGVKVGVGNRRSYFDVMMVKVADDSSSIEDPVINFGNAINPQENLLLGISTRIAFHRRLSLQIEAGGSFLNRDLRNPEIDSLSALNPFSSLFRPKVGVQFLTAGQASLQYNQKFVGIKLQYKRVDPDYRSLAAFYQQSDLQAITIEPTIRLMRNKFRISGSIGKQQDNLYRRKSYTSTRTIGSASLSWVPSKSYAADLSFSNYGVAQQAGLQVLNDTFRVAQVNRTLSLGQTISRVNKFRNLSLSLQLSYQELRDLNPYGTYANSENTVWFANMQLSRIRLRDNFNLNGGLNFSRNQMALGSYLLAGPMIGFSKPFIKDKLQMNANLAFNQGFQSGALNGTTLNLYSGLQYRVNKSHSFNFTLNILHNSTPVVNTGKFTEIRILAGYSLYFQPKS